MSSSDPSALKRSDAQPDDLPNYPTTLLNRDRWVAWKPIEDSKVPVDAATGEVGVNATDLAHHYPFETVREFVGGEPSMGMGWALSEDDHVVLVDYDNVRDPETGELHPYVADRLAETDSWADVSVSGTGIHLLGRGEWPEEWHKADLPDHPDYPAAKVEVYDEGQLVAMSGRPHPDGSDDVGDIDGLLADVADMKDDPLESSPSPSGTLTGDLRERVEYGVENSDRFRELWQWGKRSGDPDTPGGDPAEVGHPGDRSAAECELAWHLAYWLERDREAVKRAMHAANPERWGNEDPWYYESVLTAVDRQPESFEPVESGDSSPSYELTWLVLRELRADGPLSTAELVDRLAAKTAEEWGETQTRKAASLLEDHGIVAYHRDGRRGTWDVSGDGEGVPDLFEDLNSKRMRDVWLRGH